jgi:hypothetical protein
MAARPSVDVSGWLDTQLAQASPDLLRAMLKAFAEVLMSAEADAVSAVAAGTTHAHAGGRCAVGGRTPVRGPRWPVFCV